MGEGGCSLIERAGPIWVVLAWRVGRAGFRAQMSRTFLGVSNSGPVGGGLRAGPMPEQAGPIQHVPSPGQRWARIFLHL